MTAPHSARVPGKRDGSTVVLAQVSDLFLADSPRVDGVVEGHVRKLAGLETPLPPIVVQRHTMRVIDGMHRLLAAKRRGAERLPVQFFDGSDEEAFLLAVRLNAQHGLPLSRADRRAAASRFIASHPEWSDRRVAATTGLSAATVGSIRKRSTDETAQLTARTGRDGKARPLRPAEGRLRAAELIKERPESSLRQIAAAAGVAPATVRDVRERLRQGRDPVPDKLRNLDGADRRPSATAGPATRTRSATGVRAAAVTDPGGTNPLPDGPSTAVDSLRRDPSLRFSEAGRELLRLLTVNAMPRESWEQLAAAVPAHRRDVCASLAREHARRWAAFSDLLAREAESAA
ncbi:hypothetical protein GO002_13655 [Streptomyces eurocidicus]|nr:hypothetical protein [Streptomyces eurocidicus]